jgi:hypothetical protein
MNGRMYDYNVGRFMGVDPFIQFPLNSQSLNPYSYILNNPLAATDPTGYLVGCGPNYAGCGGGGPMGEHFGGGSSCRGSFCNFALGGNGTKNGAKPGSGTTPEKRDESKGGVSEAISHIGGAAKRAFLGPIIDYGERGKPGDFGDHALNGAKWVGNVFLDVADIFVISKSGNPMLDTGIPRFEYSDEGLKTPATLQGASLVGGLLKGGVSLAGRMGKAGRVAGEVAEGGAPSMRQPVAGRGAEDAARGTEGASGDLTTASGNRYPGNSTGSSASGGAPRAPMHPQVQQALDSVQNPSRSHGHCCEIDSANKALNAGDDVRGAKMGPVRLNESGRILPACSTCREVKKYLGIE